MDESILVSIKKMLGIDESYTHFDADIIMNINSVFMILNQLGVGPSKPFMITGEDEEWSDFIEEGYIEAVKTYIFLRVKVIFDPPTSSFVLDAYNKRIDELEWRMNVIVENDKEENS